VFVAQDRYASFLNDLFMAGVWLILDVFYVEQMKYRKKNKSRRNEDK